MKQLIVVNNPKNWPLDIPGVDVISAKEYISNEQFSKLSNVKVYNLCRSYRYQSFGYYVSLLASARGHKPIPDVLTIQDLKSQAIIRIVSDEMHQLIQKTLAPIQSDRFILSIYFGKNLAKRYDRIAKQLFTQFQTPLLRAEFSKKENEWILKKIQAIATNEVPEDHRPFVSQMTQEFFRRKSNFNIKKETRFDLAILVNPDEMMPPSDEKSILRFVKAAEQLNFYTELITREDASRLNEFDALFIRETTRVNHHTYRMARIAEAEGLVVIDDPKSILLCTNKVFLAELMNRHRIPVPETMILSPDNIQTVAEKLGFPIILKQPDSSFSNGVVKADQLDQYLAETEKLFETSDLLIAQAFIPTSYDWRVGVLNGTPLFGCRYHMARKHWQIYKRTDDGKVHEGNVDTVDVAQIPEKVLKYALKAANLIGNGLYGVDLKEINGDVFVIEVNDNPSIDSGIEDAILKDELYRSIMEEILHRIEKKKER